MSSSLTVDVGLKVGPIILEVLVKHYFDRLKKDAVENGKEQDLKQADVLYHEAFTIVKSFLNASTFHTVEELQAFSNTRTPSPPWVHVVRTLVPLSTCEEAAKCLIQALGGEQAAKDIVGGVKWWQVRGVNGVDAQWITAKKDWQEAKRKHKMRQEQKKEGVKVAPLPEENANATTEGVYEKDMDAMRCILYLHGGGYYFGSVDQERYSIQRFARKINGRVFAINYRLAPQYPFPCALQDAVASYLYLIRPPPGSEHQPVNPKHIIIAGDSAGGGLSLAVLQVIRDTCLPAPAGGVLISPWCDLTHSFPSIHLNTDTDIIPDCGLSFHKPSTLWPPPPPEVSTRVHASLRYRIRQTLKLGDTQRFNPLATFMSEKEVRTPSPAAVAVTIPNSTVTTPGVSPEVLEKAKEEEKITVPLDSSPGESEGEEVEIEEQVHFYTTNKLVKHPLVSPAMSYLGGLPPLLFIAGDKEVLRDEIIYSAHKAAHPDRFPIEEESRKLYPSLQALDKKDYKPTSVHLQVYDNTPHILPVLFAFTTPAKFCFRAMASFCKFVTDMPTTPASPPPIPKSGSAPNGKIVRRHSLFAGFKTAPAKFDSNLNLNGEGDGTNKNVIAEVVTESPAAIDSMPGHAREQAKSPLRRGLSHRLGRASSFFKAPTPSLSADMLHEEVPHLNGEANGEARMKDVEVPTKVVQEVPHSVPEVPKADSAEASTSTTRQPSKESEGDKTTKHADSIDSNDVGGPRFKKDKPSPLNDISGERAAGEAVVYSDIEDHTNWDCDMIRERVSTQGVVRPLEAESELDAFKVPPEKRCKMGDKTVRRYMKHRGIFHKRFSHTMKKIEKHRRRNLELAKEDTIKRLGIIHRVLHREESKSLRDGATGSSSTASSSSQTSRMKERFMASPEWGWAWVLDDTEDPPPSSIVSRRDTDEARKLAEIADKAVIGEDEVFSANNLWSIIMNFLTATPNDGGRKEKEEKKRKESEESESDREGGGRTRRSKSLSRLSRFFHHHHDTEAPPPVPTPTNP